MEYKYSLIISQCYHQHHQFIVKITPDFVEKAKQMVTELRGYKGGKDTTYLGDLDCYPVDELKRRYNYNGFEGDIYIINSDSIQYLLEKVKNYYEYELSSYKAFGRKKTVIKHLDELHDEIRVKEIIKKYFEIL